MNKITPNVSPNLDTMPYELQSYIFGQLGFTDLSAVSRVSAKVNEGVHALWEEIQKQLGYPVDPQSQPFRSYNNFVRVLSSKIQSNSQWQVPTEILDIINLAKQKAPTVAQVSKLQRFVKERELLSIIKSYHKNNLSSEIIGIQALADKGQVLSKDQIQKLQEFIEAMDKIFVWQSLAVDAEKAAKDKLKKKVRIKRPYSSNRNLENTVDFAKGFGNWIDQNKELLKQLKEFDLSENRLYAIPKELGKLTHLRRLDLRGCNLISIPPELGNLKRLKTLDLSENELAYIPRELGNLKELESLHLRGNKLAYIPKELGNLERLQVLVLNDNMLTHVPKELGKLHDLIQLYLANNQIIDLPEELGGLTNLGAIYLDNNRLTAIPKQLEKLKELCFIGIEENQLQKNQLKPLPKQRELLSIIESQYQKSLSPELAQIVSLANEGQILWPGQIDKLQKFIEANDTIFVWQSLQKAVKENGEKVSLKLPSNVKLEEIDEFAREFGYWIDKNLKVLNHLEKFDLSGAELHSIPKELGKLKYLRVLGLRGCQLTSIPKELGNLKELEILDLGQNKLISIPRQLGNLIKLEILHLDGNKLAYIPKELGKLHNLIKLDLANNQIIDLPKELGGLTNLELIVLKQNCLTKIPRQFGDLKKLRGLDLSENQLRFLPRKLSNLPELIWLDLRSNPWDHPQKEQEKFNQVKTVLL